MKIWRRPTIVEVVLVLVILLGGVYLFEGRFPSWQERKRLSQNVVANFDDMDLQTALQSLIDQTDGSVTMTVCTDLLKYKVSVKSKGSIPVRKALNEIATQIPTKYYPYGMLDVAIAHPVFLCKDRNETALTIKRMPSSP